MARIPCIACGAPIPPERDNCPECGQRQLTFGTAVVYMTVGLPAVLLCAGVGALLAAPELVASTVGIGGLMGGLVAVYAAVGLVLWRAYARRRARIRRSARSEGARSEE
ncbi:hypothetical protein [Halomarina pelagica]|uniref:hypothetical protein n=1 Tax=Halomarina pelagica TaxID=2961599 RepID=UPI0020C46CD5|nr:hypothetical protein [Halomarina sp. BND7]